MRTGCTPNGEPLDAQAVHFLAAFKLAQAMDYRMKAGPGIRI